MIGLRAQITLALVTALGLSVVLVAVASDRLITRALEDERARNASLAAGAAAVIIGRADAPGVLLDHAEEAILGHAGVTGFEVVPDDGEALGRGVTEGAIVGEAPIDGGSVRVYVADAEAGSARALVRLVVLYTAASAIAILLFSYLLLTFVIVRPVEGLTRASERLARGRPGARADVRGAAEVAQLAVSFNAMAADLERERAALEARLLELEKATRELEAAQSSLVRSEKLASVGRLAAGVAHEIGNPLTSILGLVELLQDGIPPAEQAEFLRRIRAETERIHRIIRELLDFARKDEKEVVSPVDLATVIEHAVQLVAPQKDLRRIRVERRIEDGVPAVRGSEDRLVQVLLNLLLNAADAIDGEGGITIELGASEGGVRLAVSDTGKGIAPEMREKLFEPFATTKPVGKGTGLGLAVCHSIVERLGGRITAGAAEGGGAKIEIWLPAST